MDIHSRIFLATMTLLIGTNTFIYSMFFHRRNSSNWVEHTFQVRDEINRLAYNVRTAESAQRGYLLTKGNKKFLQPYQLAVEEKNVHLKNLKALTKDNTNQQDRLILLDKLLKSKFQELNKTLEYAGEFSDLSRVNQALKLVESGYGNDLSIQIESLLSNMTAEEDVLLVQRIRERGDRERYELLSYSISVLIGIVTLVIVFYFAKDDAYRLSSLVSLKTSELELHKKEIENKSKELSVALDEKTHALDAAQKLNELKSRIINIVSHEYRTPLTTILSSAELLEIYGERWDVQKRNKKLKTIQTVTKHLTKIVNDVLLSSRETISIDFNPEACNLNQLVLDIIEETYNTGANTVLDVDEHDNIVVYSTGMAVDNALFDERLIRQILINLLTNAIKYSPEYSSVRVGISWQSDSVNISVSDSGIGIPEEDREKLFGVFHRASNVGTIQGIGIGLSIVKQCVERHGGTITFESVENQGTTFIVQLPLLIQENMNNIRNDNNNM